MKTPRPNLPCVFLPVKNILSSSRTIRQFSAIKMLIYFLISILLNHFTIQAAPIICESADAPLAVESKGPLPRTLFGIIWSCISTIIICAWASVHPNVPPPNRWKARWNRLRLMFWMIVAPELVLTWAVRQYFGAREIRDEYNRVHPSMYDTK